MAPEARPSGREGMDVFRKHAGWADRMKNEQAARFTDDTWRAANQMSPDDQRKWVNYIEGANDLHRNPNSPIYDPNWQPPPELRQATADLKKSFGEWEKEISTWPQAQQTQFRQEYLNHMWKNPPAIGENVGGTSQRGSLKQRVHETDEAGRAAGLEPVTTNPLERLNNYTMAMGRVMAELKTQKTLEDRGALGWFKPQTVAASGTPNPYRRGAPPEGYTAVNHWFNKDGAQAYVPTDMAALLNNIFAPNGGFSSSRTKDIFDSVRRFKNFQTAIELGVSLYHPFTTGFDSVASGVTRAFQQLGTGPGSTQRAANSFAKAWIEPVVNAIPIGTRSFRQQHGIADPLGQQWIEKYQGLRPANAQDKRVLDAMTSGGIRPVGTSHALDFELSKMGDKGSLWTSYKRGSLQKEFNDAWQAMGNDKTKIPSVLIDGLVRVLQTTAHPIFQTYIPRLKMAGIAQDMQAFMHANPSATDEELASVARKFSDVATTTASAK